MNSLQCNHLSAIPRATATSRRNTRKTPKRITQSAIPCETADSRRNTTSASRRNSQTVIPREVAESRRGARNYSYSALRRRLLVLTAIILAGLLPPAFAAEIERLEPPNWWIGFNEPDVRLLVYGEGIGELRPTVNHPGVTLLDTLTTENPNYLFLRLRIDADAEPGVVDIEFSGPDAEITHPWPLDARNPDPNHTRGFSPADAIYLITPDRFANGDPSNDAIDGLGDIVDREQPGARHGGDLRGIIDRLDYIAGLGFTAVWLNPVLENAMPSYSYHGYATTDFYRVDPRMGSNADLAELARVGREKGVGLIMDMIVNHSGLHHWWMDDPPMEDWVHQWDGYVETNHAKTLSVDPYAAEIDRREFYDGWFVPSMPDLNQDNPLMAEYLIQNAIWWIEYLGLTGVRMDTYPYSGVEFMAAWTRRVMQEFPDFNVVGEEWTENPLIVAFWQAGDSGLAGQNDFRSWLPSVMDFPLNSVLARALTAEDSFSDGLMELYSMLANDVLYPDPGALVIFGDNHDMMRMYSQLGEDYAAFELAMAYLATMRGAPQVYYGTEILATSSDDHGVIRSNLPGGWAGDSTDAVSGAGLTDEQLRAQALVRTLFNWRKTSSVIHQGELTHFLPKEGVYVYFRSLGEEQVMVVLNKNSNPHALDPARFAEVLGDARSGTDIIRGGAHDLTSPIELTPRTALILEVD